LIKSSAVILLAVLFIPAVSTPAEENYTLPRDYRTELDNGIGYFYNIPPSYYSKGTAGVLMILGGPKSDKRRLLEMFHGTERSHKNYLDEFNWIAIAPETKDDAWRPDDVYTMKAFMDIAAKYTIDLKRVHILGLGIAGTLAANIGYGRADILTIFTVGSSVANVNKDLLVKYPQKRVYMLISEKDKQRKAAEKVLKLINSSSGRYARLRFVEGNAEVPPLRCELPAMFAWYKAMECGFDYASAIDSAKAKLQDSIEGAISKVREIEAQPYEDGFWKELGAVRDAINAKGEVKLNQCQTLLKTDPATAKTTLTKLLELFEGFPVADKVKAELERLETVKENK
jgi:hypothetical protein